MNKIVRYCERCGFRAEVYISDEELNGTINPGRLLETSVERATRMFNAGHVCWGGKQ